MKPHLLILHGAIGAKKQFATLVKILSEDFTVHCLEFYGHGDSIDFDGEISIDLFVQQTKEFLEVNKIDKPFVFGYSMGGYVALRLEAELQGSFSSVLTLGTKFDWNPESAARESKMVNPEKIKEKIPQFANYLETLHGNNWEKLLIKTGSMMLEMGDQPPITTSLLKGIQIPVKCVRGSQDVMVSEDETRWAVDAIPNSSYLEIVDWPHPIDKLPTSDLAKMIERFFLKS